ncbi:ribbon-helix-helix domain-containing protein [Neorhizobium sp. NPDC001467]|uniref:ribbon-helix-helix domain-containing protein n=1 Tax=Neorhizobium sp. NPDC001467 TaxID=3390595 RepID=UPI003D05CBE8
MRALTVSLTPQQAEMMEAAVQNGHYASSSEIVRDAPELWEQRQELRQRETARLKQAYDEGMASGEGRRVDADTLLAALKAEAPERG